MNLKYASVNIELSAENTVEISSFITSSDIFNFHLALDLWCDKEGIKQCFYNSLLKVLRLLNCEEVWRLSHYLETLQWWCQNWLPLLTIQRVTVPVHVKKQPTGKAAKSQNNLYYFDTWIIANTILSAFNGQSLHTDMAEIIDCPSEYWQLNCWGSSICTCFNDFLMYSDHSPILSFWLCSVPLLSERLRHYTWPSLWTGVLLCIRLKVSITHSWSASAIDLSHALLPLPHPLISSTPLRSHQLHVWSGVSRIELTYHSSIGHTSFTTLYNSPPSCCASSPSDLAHFSLHVDGDKVVSLHLLTGVAGQSDDVVREEYCTSTKDWCENTSLKSMKVSLMYCVVTTCMLISYIWTF